MVLMAPVVAEAIEACRGTPPAWRVLLSPDGVRLDQATVERLGGRERLLLVCGRYEGIDERVRELGLFDEEISIGDFVLSGGEAAALVLIEAISRRVPGVVGKAESVERGVLRSRSARLPALHAAAGIPRPRGPRGSPLRRPCGDREVEAGRARSSAPALAGPISFCGGPRSRGKRDRAESPDRSLEAPGEPAVAESPSFRLDSGAFAGQAVRQRNP
jgi:hypothetical protein